MFVPNCRRCPLSLNLMSFVLNGSKSCTLCPLPLTQSYFFVKYGHRRERERLSHHYRHSSATSHRSISGTDTDSQLDKFHFPLRVDSPLRSDDIISSTSTSTVTVDKFRSPISFRYDIISSTSTSTSTAIVTVDKFRSPIRSPLSGTASSPPPPLPLPSPSSPIRSPLSVMVSDKTQGWSGDSFDRYMEYKYVLLNFVANCVI
ncbi:hypothetical protein Hanom_Chr02g00106591 [Helianthus anomalus]